MGGNGGSRGPRASGASGAWETGTAMETRRAAREGGEGVYHVELLIRRGLLLHRSGDLRATGELYTGELHTPTSFHSEIARKYCAQSPCCKRMFQVL